MANDLLYYLKTFGTWVKTTGDLLLLAIQWKQKPTAQSVYTILQTILDDTRYHIYPNIDMDELALLLQNEGLLEGILNTMIILDRENRSIHSVYIR